MAAQIQGGEAGVADSQRPVADSVFAFPNPQTHLNHHPIIKLAKMELMKPPMTILKPAHLVAVEITGYLQVGVEVPKEVLPPSAEAIVQFVVEGKIDLPAFRFALYGSFCFATFGNLFPPFMRFFMAVKPLKNSHHG